MKYEKIKEECYKANLQLPDLKLVIYTFGNVSVADHSEGCFAIKPSGVIYNELQLDDIVIVDFDNNIIEGKMRPSSDTKPMPISIKLGPISGQLRIHTQHIPWPGPRPKKTYPFWELPMLIILFATFLAPRLCKIN